MQANRRDLCGQRFGKLTVIRRVEGTQSNRARADSWLCRCDCGNESVVLGSNLVRGHTKSCGCIKLNDLTGQHIGSLTVLGRSDKYATRGKRSVRLWECKCDCGAITYVEDQNVMPMRISQGRDLGDWPLYMQPIDGTTQVIKSGIVIVIAETRLMFHTKLWCMAISKAVAAKKENMKANLAPI